MVQFNMQLHVILKKIILEFRSNYNQNKKTLTNNPNQIITQKSKSDWLSKEHLTK